MVPAKGFGPGGRPGIETKMLSTEVVGSLHASLLMAASHVSKSTQVQGPMGPDLCGRPHACFVVELWCWWWCVVMGGSCKPGVVVCVGGRRDKGRGVGQVLANKSSHCAPYPQRMVKGIRTLDLLDNRGIQLPTRVV